MNNANSTATASASSHSRAADFRRSRTSPAGFSTPTSVSCSGSRFILCSHGPCAACRSILVLARPPCPPKPTLFPPDIQNGHEGLLGNLHAAQLLHPLLPLLLPLQELSLSGDIAPVQVGSDLFAKGLDALPGDDLAPDRSLQHNLKELSGDELAESGHELPSPLIGLIPLDDGRQGIHRLPVHQDVELHQVPLPVVDQLIIQRAVPPRQRFEPVVEIEDDLGQREIVGEDGAALLDVFQTHPNPLLLLAEGEDRTDMLPRGHDHGPDVRFFDGGHTLTGGETGGVIYLQRPPVREPDPIDNRRGGGQEFEIELPL